MNDPKQVRDEFAAMMEANEVHLSRPREVGAARLVVLNRLYREGKISREEHAEEMRRFREEFGVE